MLRGQHEGQGCLGCWHAVLRGRWPACSGCADVTWGRIVRRGKWEPLVTVCLRWFSDHPVGQGIPQLPQS